MLTARVAFTITTSLTPTGNVTFTEGGTVLGTGTVSNGVATVQINSAQPFLAVGTHAITATYGADSNFLGSRDTRNQVVNPIQSTTVIAPAATTIVFGQSATNSASDPGPTLERNVSTASAGSSTGAATADFSIR